MPLPGAAESCRKTVNPVWGWPEGPWHVSSRTATAAVTVPTTATGVPTRGLSVGHAFDLRAMPVAADGGACDGVGAPGVLAGDGVPAPPLWVLGALAFADV